MVGYIISFAIIVVGFSINKTLLGINKSITNTEIYTKQLLERAKRFERILQMVKDSEL
jgi:hypothetical protein